MPKLVPVLIFCLCGLAFGQDLAAIHQKIRAAGSERNYPAAITELETLKNQNREIFEANNYDYLLGRMAEKSGDFAAASASYAAVAKRNSVLKEYALWHLSKIAGSTGNLLLERMYLQELTTLFPNSLLTGAANNRLARNLFESRSYESAIDVLTSRTDGAGGAVNRANLALMADAYYRAGNYQKARELFTRLISETSNPAQPDDVALAGAKGLDLLDGGAENFGKSAPALTDWEHLRRAQIYQFNRDFNDARLHFNSIIANHPDSGLVPDAVFQIGRGYVQQGNFTEAIVWFERVLEQFGEHPVAADALLQAASAYARAMKYREAIVRYERFIGRYPDDERAARAHLNIVDTLRDNREDTEALQWAAKVQEIFRGKQVEALALFSEARIYISRSDWQNALPALQKLGGFADLGGTRVPGGTTAAEVKFLRAYSLEQLGRYPEAIDLYLSIPDGRDSYYGARATERLQLMANQESAGTAIANSRHGLLSIAANDPEAQRKRIQAALRIAIDAGERQTLL
jgi:tetratricopeptide (TPR) repeat protein